MHKNNDNSNIESVLENDMHNLDDDSYHPQIYS